MKVLLGLYLATVFTCRITLRTSCAENLHWAVVMALEDGMSLLSFAVGLYVLHRSNGAPLTLLAKSAAAHIEGAAAPFSQRTRALVSEEDRNTYTEKRFKLFNMAL
ncbi:psd [Symbiodinium natans]|uniref:Psd protein n=1 Tax=Symbiodinium natans TaxID=878477 RepID=A0A812LHF4_9DINO|nr:psd [Symbiodinium natans]